MNDVLEILPTSPFGSVEFTSYVSPKSKNATIFLVSFVVPVLLVTQTSTFVMFIPELIKGKFFNASSY